MLLIILLVRESKVKPLLLLQFDKSPFFGSLIIRPVVNSFFINISFQTFSKIHWRITGYSTSSACSISAVLPSKPPCSPLFIALIATVTASSVGGFVTMSRGSSTAVISCEFYGSGLSTPSIFSRYNISRRIFNWLIAGGILTTENLSYLVESPHIWSSCFCFISKPIYKSPLVCFCQWLYLPIK